MRMTGRMAHQRGNVCGCCAEMAGTGNGRKGARRAQRRRERQQWRREIGKD